MNLLSLATKIFGTSNERQLKTYLRRIEAVNALEGKYENMSDAELGQQTALFRERLAKGEQTVSELAEPYRMSLAAASKHIQTLERAGLVKRTVRGRIHYCRIDPRPLERADDWLRAYERLWDTRIERLAELLRHPENEPSE